MAPTTLTFRQFLLRAHTSGALDISKHFELQTDATITYDPEDMQGKVLVKLRWFSNDPAQRTWINGVPEDRHYWKVMQPGEVVQGQGIGEVLESGNDAYHRGELVIGFFGWSEYALVDASTIQSKVLGDPPETIALGVTGLTAYFGLMDVASPKPSDKVIVVSAAAGATGSIVVQIAKRILNIPTVIGIAGGPEKCALVRERCGADIVLDYKSPSFDQDLVKATSGFIDIYFDNVGGRIADMCVDRMARNGRVVLCGNISSYDEDEGSGGCTISNRSYFRILSMRLTLRGFIVADFLSQFAVATEKIARWASEGKITPLTTVFETRFENVPEGMMMLLQGKNVGKLVTKLVEETLDCSY